MDIGHITREIEVLPSDAPAIPATEPETPAPQPGPSPIAPPEPVPALAPV